MTTGTSDDHLLEREVPAPQCRRLWLRTSANEREFMNRLPCNHRHLIIGSHVHPVRDRSSTQCQERCSCLPGELDEGARWRRNLPAICYSPRSQNYLYLTYGRLAQLESFVKCRCDPLWARGAAIPGREGLQVSQSCLRVHVAPWLLTYEPT
jgi:hypothetical protein